MFEHLVGDYGESVSARHQVGRQHHRVDLLSLDRFVARNAASCAEDAEALHATTRRLGQVELYAKAWGQIEKRSKSNTGTDVTVDTRSMTFNQNQFILDQ